MIHFRLLNPFSIEMFLEQRRENVLCPWRTLEVCVTKIHFSAAVKLGKCVNMLAVDIEHIHTILLSLPYLACVTGILHQDIHLYCPFCCVHVC